MTLLSNATILRGIACTRVKYMQKTRRFFMLAVHWQLEIFFIFLLYFLGGFKLEICDSDTLH